MTGGRVHESLSSPGPLACSRLGGALVGVPAQRRTGRGQSWRRGRGPSKAGRRLRPQPSCTGTALFKGGGTGGEGCSPCGSGGDVNGENDKECGPRRRGSASGVAAAAGAARSRLTAGVDMPCNAKKRPPRTSQGPGRAHVRKRI